jgi:osmotically-inducible protein OsmY
MSCRTHLITAQEVTTKENKDMSSRYSDREYDRTYDREDDRYGRRSSYGYGGSYGETARRYGSSESDRDYGVGGRGRDYGREYERERDYELGRYGTSDYQRGYGSRYNEPSSLYSEEYNYPSRYRSAETYGSRYGLGSDYDRGYYSERGPRDRRWWDRASDEVASWFGDEEAERRRRLDEQQSQYRGRGPRGYQRSDSRITEDINDRLTDDPYLDATDIEVKVSNREVTLTGSVENRASKRRAESIVEAISGVTDVHNNLRVIRPEMVGATTSSTTTAEKTTATRAARGSAS